MEFVIPVQTLLTALLLAVVTVRQTLRADVVTYVRMVTGISLQQIRMVVKHAHVILLEPLTIKDVTYILENAHANDMLQEEIAISVYFSIGVFLIKKMDAALVIVILEARMTTIVMS